MANKFIEYLIGKGARPGEAIALLRAYAAQVEAYKAKVAVYIKMVDNATHANDALRYTMTNFINQPAEKKMPDVDKEVFRVFQAANGFYARMRNGALVVGMTLSEVCSAAQAAAAEHAITSEDEHEEDEEDDAWQKV